MNGITASKNNIGYCQRRQASDALVGTRISKSGGVWSEHLSAEHFSYVTKPHQGMRTPTAFLT